MEPCAFSDGGLVALAFTGLKDTVADVNEGMFAKECAPSHLPPILVSLKNIACMNHLVLSLMS